jgi:hypothetical protein
MSPTDGSEDSEFQRQRLLQDNNMKEILTCPHT